MSTATKQVRVTSTEMKHIERLCRNKMMWTDGGYWMGHGKEPNCFQNLRQTKTTRITINWPTDDSAKRWNDNWAKAQRNIGYSITLLTSVVAWQLNLPKVAVGIGIGSDLLMDLAYKMTSGSDMRIAFDY